MTAFSNQQVDQLRAVFREELAGAGLRIGDEDQKDQAREDFRFLRIMRRSISKASTIVGSFIVLSLVGGIVWLIERGITAWQGHV